MHSRNMSADNDKVQTFYPKFWWRFLMVLPGGSLFIGFGLFAEFMMKPNNIRKGGGYAIAAICAGIMVYMLLKQQGRGRKRDHPYIFAVTC